MAPKKNKEQTFNLSSFASLSGDQNSSWADEEETSFKAPAKAEFITNPMGAGAPWSRGPTAPSEGGWKSFGSESAPIPDAPPFTARVGNVSYNVTEEDLEQFFGVQHNLQVASVRLPRNADGQVRGSAYVDFADRQSLVTALSLGGELILDRKVSVQVAEQRTGGFGAGGGEFDWGKRAAPGEGFGSRSDFGAPRGPPGVDRLSRFRRNADEPEIDWSSRVAPGVARGAGVDFSSRPPPRFREPEPEFNWGARKAPPAAVQPLGGPRRDRAPRAPREAEPEPEFDWGKRTAAPAALRNNNHNNSHKSSSRSSGPELDWSKKPSKKEPELNWGASRGGAGAPGAGAGSAEASAAPVVEDPAKEAQKREKERIAGMSQGFKALQIDEEEDENTQDAQNKPAAPKEANSIGAIQQAQREATTGGWNKA